MASLHDFSMWEVYGANGSAGKPRSNSSAISRRNSSWSRIGARLGSRQVFPASCHPAAMASLRIWTASAVSSS